MKHSKLIFIILCSSIFFSSLFVVPAMSEPILFTEDFESGYEGWEHISGDILSARTQRLITQEGDYAFRMTGIQQGSLDGHSGRYRLAST